MTKIEIYYDKNKSDFYVKIIREGDMLPENIGDFLQSHRMKLAAEHPDYGTKIANPKADLTDEDKTIIHAFIKEYNDSHLGSEERYIVKKGSDVLTALDLGRMPSENLTDTGYTAGEDEILNFIAEKRREYSRVEYLVFKCPECGKIQFSSINKGAVSCDNADCAKRYTSFRSLLEGEPPAAIAYYSSDDVESPRITASRRCREAIAAAEAGAADNRESIPRLATFTYKETTYRITPRDIETLHSLLYREFACGRVFEKRDRRILFREDYLRYLRSLAGEGIMKDLYLETDTVVRYINSQEYSIGSIERAFYWYFNEYRLMGDAPYLVRKGGNGKIYTFRTHSEYVQALLNSTGEERAVLRGLFDDLSCAEKGFFAGYEESDIELSRLIYDCKGIFVYIKEDRYENFGADFIAKLTAEDDKTSLRSEFLRKILSSTPFREKIKGKSRGLRMFVSQHPANYDSLCYYRYEIEGRSCLHFKSIDIENSEKGWEYVKEIVLAAYLEDRPCIKKGFADLVSLAKCPNLYAELNGVFKAGDDDGLTFSSLCESLVNVTGDFPPIKLFLLCCYPEKKKLSVFLRYNGDTKKIGDHVNDIMEKTKGTALINALKAFYDHADVQESLRYYFDNQIKGGYDEQIRARNEAFNTLKNTIEGLKIL